MRGRLWLIHAVSFVLAGCSGDDGITSDSGGPTTATDAGSGSTSGPDSDSTSTSATGSATGGTTDPGSTSGTSSGGSSSGGAGVCGDGLVEGDETCDDANAIDNDGCDADCQTSGVVQIASGTSHRCVVTRAATVRCWGSGGYGRLGYGNTQDVGDDETPASVGDVQVGAPVSMLAAGNWHTCALLTDGNVRCWGQSPLGYENLANIGDNEYPEVAGNVNIGGTAVQIAAGTSFTCAVLDTGALRCWGSGGAGKLGYGSFDTIGDDEPPADAGDVDLGGTVETVSLGDDHACAVLTGGSLLCWGSGSYGRHGHPNTGNIGDDETPASVGAVSTGASLADVYAGWWHTCGRTRGGDVMCWGRGLDGRLGYQNTDNVGDDETPGSVGTVDLGAEVATVVAAGGASGMGHSCALYLDGTVRCWGSGEFGALGQGNTDNIGDDEAITSVPTIDVGGSVTLLVAGGAHTCAVLDTGAVRCWGTGTLGYGNTDRIGDDETPASAGDIPLFE